MGDIQRFVLARRKGGVSDATILSELVPLSQTIKLITRLGYAHPDIDIAQIKDENKLSPSTHAHGSLDRSVCVCQ
jgi:hypothetical protein